MSLPSFVCFFSGLIFLRISVMAIASFSRGKLTFLNFFTSSLVVMGLRIKYRRTASSFKPSTLRDEKIFKHGCKNCFDVGMTYPTDAKDSTF